MRRLEKLEAAERAQAEATQRLQETSSDDPFLSWEPPYTPEQRAVVNDFKAWFVNAFPPVIDPDPVAGPLVLPPLNISATFEMAKDDFIQWWLATYPDTPLDDYHPYRYLILCSLDRRVYTELYRDLVPIEQRRYFFDPGRLAAWVSSKDENGKERLLGSFVVTLRIIKHPTGALLDRAQKFAKAWPGHNPARRLVGVLSVEDIATEDYEKRRAAYDNLTAVNHVPTDWIPPGCEGSC